MRPISPVLLLLALAQPSPSTAQGAELDALIPGAIAFHNDASSHVLAELGAGQVEALRAGETVVVRRRTRDAAGHDLEWVYAYALDTQPRRDIWLAATRPGFSNDEDLSSIGIERHDDGRTLTFLHLDLPWPMDDRWWMATVAMDVELAEASGGRIWARRWSLAEDGPARARALAAAGVLGSFTAADLDEGLTLPTNEGAYLVFDLDGRHTLIGYASLIGAGGDVPKGFFARFARRTLQRSIARILAEAPDVPAHYSGDHPVCVDGFGRPIERFPSGAVRRTLVDEVR